MSDPIAPVPARAPPEPTARGPRPDRGVVATRLRVVIVDDELPMRRTLARLLAARGFEVRTCEDGAQAIASVEAEPADVVLLDLAVPRGPAIDVLIRIKQLRPDAEVLVIAAVDEVDAALAAVRAGAYDFLAKPFASPESVVLAVEKAAEHRSLLERAQRLERTLASEDPAGEIVGTSAAIREVRRLVEALAQGPSPVVVAGEAGTGKEFVARAIHDEGPRADRPFVPVPCASLPEAVLEGELFGWVREPGSSPASREGLLEAADGGTVFLDEVSALTAPTQVKLLEVLRDGEVRRLGSGDVRRIDVRVLASTTADLREAVQRGALREDLYYRLQVARIPLPPLRERREDIPVLASHFLRRYARRLGRDVRRLSKEALAELERRPWPGNVRELENVVERAVVLATDDVVKAEDLPPPYPAAEGVVSLPDLTLLPFREAKSIALKAFEREYVGALLRRTKGNVTQAARRAELDRSNFRRLVRKVER